MRCSGCRVCKKAILCCNHSVLFGLRDEFGILMHLTRQMFMTGLLASALCGGGAAALAESVILTLKNPKIAGPHGEIAFTFDALSAMPQHTILTGNDYIDGVSEFRGPLAFQIVDLIGRAGARKVRFIGANDFFAEISIEELREYGTVLALTMDGERLSRRDKGPIWVMYPIDSYPELRDSVYNNRLVAQLKAIELF